MAHATAQLRNCFAAPKPRRPRRYVRISTAGVEDLRWTVLNLSPREREDFLATGGVLPYSCEAEREQLVRGMVERAQ